MLVRVAERGAGSRSELLNSLVEAALPLSGERGGTCLMGVDARSGLVDHATHHIRKISGRVRHLLGSVYHVRGAFEDDYFDGAVNIARQGDETCHFLIHLREVRLFRLQRLEDGVHGDVPVMKRAYLV